MVPAQITLEPNRWSVYLMHRADRGWRIGTDPGPDDDGWIVAQGDDPSASAAALEAFAERFAGFDDVEVAAKQLFHDVLLHPEFAHHRAAGRSLSVTMFAAGAHHLVGDDDTSRAEPTWAAALELAKRAAEAGGLTLRRRLMVDRRAFDLVPLSHLLPGCRMLSLDGDRWVDDRVLDVSTDEYDGPVYDLG
jgi:DNA helicase-2/ATP-dependent DNA helicase PcrA